MISATLSEKISRYTKSEKQHVQLFAYQVLYSVFLGEKIKWNDTSGMLSHISDFFFLSRIDVKFLKADLDLFIFNLAFVDRMGKEYRRQSLWWRQTQSKISKRGKL